MSILWVIIVVLLLVWLLGGPVGRIAPLSFGGNINWVWILIIVLLILALSGRL